TRLLISAIQHDHKASMDLVIITGSILILAIAIFIVRYASWHYPSAIQDKHQHANTNKPLQPQDDELA
ncbi:MAG: phosphate starvation protein, partial [Acinetobacter sp.]